MAFDVFSPNTALVSKVPETGKVLVIPGDDDGWNYGVVRVDGVWSKGCPSADELKDYFERVTDPKEAEMLLQEASAAAKRLIN